jgi:FAD dependent oxidoreductase TIGR03364
MSRVFDDAVVGAGIVGLAHAYQLAKRGRRVVVFERSERASGASVRNFGMLWPIGQPAGPLRDLALRSVEIWHDVLRQSGLWHDRSGSLHLAYHADEAQILREFAASAKGTRLACELLSPEHVISRSRAVRLEGLVAGLWSPSETCVDPREVVGELPNWLASTFSVEFERGMPVLGFDGPRVRTPGGDWHANHLWVCAGDDLHTLFPELLREARLVRCKLQMMRSEPYAGSWRLGPMIAAGLTLRHYKSFESCPTLPAFKARIAAETPEFDRYGIHVLVSQNGRGEVVIGDSHEYGDAIEPFDKPEIDALIVRYLQSFLVVPELRIAARWHGTYAKHPTAPYLVADPCDGATVIAALGGAGMTFSFGLAEQVVRKVLED